jgi:hypothetical protein
MLSAEDLDRLKTIHPQELADELGLDFRPTLRGGMLCATWRGEKKRSVSYLKSSRGQWYWRDFGTGEGGSHIDLIMKQMGVNYGQAIYTLKEISDGNGSLLASPSFSFSLPFSKRSESSWGIESISSCRESYIQVLLDQRHLRSESIPLSKLKWITICHSKKKFRRKCYGIKNSSGGYELFSGYPSDHSLSFKSCCGPKDISIVNRSNGNWMVSESIIDAISAQELCKYQNISLISLNGVGQVERVGRFLSKYRCRIETLILALDHDPAGEVAQQKIIKYCLSFKISFDVLNYSGKDPNDALAKLSVCKKQ